MSESKHSRECFNNMVGKNNSYLRESKSNDHFKRFSLRKLNIGVVSVAIAAGFYFGNGATAQAETSTTIQNQQGSNTNVSASNGNSAISGTTPAPATASVPETPDYSEIKNEQKPQSNVDLSLWKWQTADSTKGYNGIKLTGYTGAVDENATIYVPNNVDFIKAGKIKAGQSVYLDDLSDIRNCRRLIIDNHDGGKVIFVRNPTGSIPTFISEYLEYIDVSGADTHLLTDMSKMFFDAPNLKRIVGLENFDTSHVQSFELMFGWDPQLMDIGDLSKWDVSKVENFNEMFQLDKNLTNIGNLDNWDVSQAKSFENMFMGTEKLKSIGSLKDWQVKNVTDMPGMFLLSSIVGVDMSNWDVSSLKDVSYMFAYNYNPRFTNLELPNFSKAKLENWLQAFLDDNYLENINISGWDFVDDLNYNKELHDAADGADNLFDKWLSTSGVNGLTVNTIGAKWPSDLDLMPENSDFDYNPQYGVTGNGISRLIDFEGADKYIDDIKYSEKPTPLVVLTDNQTLLGYNKQRSESNRPNEITLVDKNGKVIEQYQMPIFYTSIAQIKKQISQYEDEFTQNYPKATFTFTLVDPETHQELTEKQIENLTPAQLVMATYLVRQNAKATVDKSQLQKDIDQGTQIKKNDKYRNADVYQQKALDDAIKNGQDVLNDPKADQKKVDNADKAITDALNGLKGQPTDKSQLQKGKDDNNKGDQPTNPTTPTKPDDNKSNKPVTPTNPAKPDNGNKGTDTPVTPSKPTDNKGDQPTTPTIPAQPDHGNASISGQAGHKPATSDNGTQNGNNNGINNGTQNGNGNKTVNTNVTDNGNGDKTVNTNVTDNGNGDKTVNTNVTDNGNGNKTVNTNVTNNGNGDNSQNNKQALPQTGNTKNDAAVAGLGLAGLLAMLGLGGLKKKRN